MIPVENGQVVTRLGPSDGLSLTLELLELHGELSLLDFVVGESLEVRGESESVRSENEPFGRIPAEGGRSVSVVGGELVVEAEQQSVDEQQRAKERQTCDNPLRA